MKETARIDNLLQCAFEGNAWHGPAVREVLAGVTAKDAISKPIASAHSIWELVLHIAAWSEIVRRRVAGEQFVVTAEMDWPAVTSADESAWNIAKDILERAQASLRQVVAALPESRLDEIPFKDGPSVYVLLHGVIQHHIYHAGQIAMLKKAL